MTDVNSILSAHATDLQILNENRVVTHLFNFGTAVRAIDWSPNGKYIAIGCTTTPYFYVLDAVTKNILFQTTWFVNNSGGNIPSVVLCARFSPNSQYLAISTNTSTGRLQVIRTSNWTTVGTMTTSYATNKIDWSYDSSLFLATTTSTAAATSIYVIDNQCINNFPRVNTPAGACNGCVWSKTNYSFYIGRGNYIDRYDESGGSWTLAATSVSLATTTINSLDVMSDGLTFAFAATGTHKVELIQFTNAAMSSSSILKGLGGTTTGTAVRFNKNQDKLLIARVPYALFEWDLVTGTTVELGSLATQIYDIAYSPNRKLISNRAYQFQTEVAADSVSIFDWDTGYTIDTVTPDSNGVWESYVFPGKYGVNYFKDGCPPVAHGPYTIT